MEEKPITTWEDFERSLSKLNPDVEETKKHIGCVSKPLFRGQTNFEWPLKTTLERCVKQEFGLQSYYGKILDAKTEIETFTDSNWDMPTYLEYGEWLETLKEGLTFVRLHDFKAYDYMIYLRHHGFPSPLLDWTMSPYVAAFFAYRDVEKDGNKKVENVSIYAYREYIGRPKSTSSDKPYIISPTPDVKTHKRHFLQQSQHTICIKETSDHTDLYYSNHEEVFSENNEQQDKLYKFKLPVSQRIEFLKKLDSMNINAFSLFGTEESLMETIALRKLEFKD